MNIFFVLLSFACSRLRQSVSAACRHGTTDEIKSSLVEQRRKRVSNVPGPVDAISVHGLQAVYQVVIAAGSLADELLPARKESLVLRCAGSV